MIGSYTPSDTALPISHFIIITRLQNVQNHAALFKSLSPVFLHIGRELRW